MGLALALVAATFTATQELKNLIENRVRILLDGGSGSVQDIDVCCWWVGSIGAGAPTFVTYEICRNQGSDLKNDGFTAWPSGVFFLYVFDYLLCWVNCCANEPSFVRGYGILDLWLACAKFSVAFPYIGPLAFGARAPAAAN